MRIEKALLTAVLLLSAMSAAAQTFVSTTPQKRNALIEEYTGVNCSYCPLGHKTVDEMSAMYPGRVFAINIHQGSFASMYTTQWGNALAQQAGINSYPSATLNRHAFSGSSIKINPGDNYLYVPQVLEMDAPVNVAAVVDIDPATRLMTVRVEAYYTTNSTAEYNLLNVALLQSNVYGSQAGGSSYYPENMVNGRYHHKHMLRDLLTGQWGDTIRQTTAGSFFTKEYAYVVPNSIGNLNIDDMDDLSVVVFITESHREVLNATEAIRASDNASLAYSGVDRDVCDYNVQPFVAVTNGTAEAISNMRFTVDGSSLVANKTIAPYTTDTVRLPLFSLDPLPADHQHYSASRTVEFNGYTSGGQQVNLNGEQQTFDIADFDLYTSAGPLTLSIRYDGYPAEVSFSLFGYGDCSYYYQTSGLSNQAGQTVTYTLSPANTGVYRLWLTDVGSDGVSGTIAVTDANGNTLFSRNGSGLTQWDYYFNITTAGSDGPMVGIASVEAAEIEVYPNPVTEILTVKAEGLRQAALTDMNGRVVVYASGNRVFMGSLPSGVYLLCVVTDNGVITKRIIKK